MHKLYSLNQVFTRQWAVPILAQLASTNGCKFVTLTKSLAGSRSSLKASLKLLDKLGLVKPNTGLGHPLRPEYLLTTQGELISKPAAALIVALLKSETLEQGLRKWSMPTVYAIELGSNRFSTISDTLHQATDRAVSLTLMGLQSASMVQRELIDNRPPYNLYKLTRKTQKLFPILMDMNHAMN